MKSPRPPRWRRTVAGRRETNRRLIAYGAFVGLAAGIVSLLLIGTDVRGSADEIVPLALMLPAGIYVLWWIAFPGMALDRVDVVPDAEQQIDVDERVRTIEATFDDLAVPGARKRSILPADRAATAQFRASIRRGRATTPEDMAQFGISRPAVQPPSARADQG